jgi:hypothetical protein
MGFQVMAPDAQDLAVGFIVLPAFEQRDDVVELETIRVVDQNAAASAIGVSTPYPQPSRLKSTPADSTIRVVIARFALISGLFIHPSIA